MTIDQEINLLPDNSIFEVIWSDDIIKRALRSGPYYFLKVNKYKFKVLEMKVAEGWVISLTEWERGESNGSDLFYRNGVVGIINHGIKE